MLYSVCAEVETIYQQLATVPIATEEYCMTNMEERPATLQNNTWDRMEAYNSMKNRRTLDWAQFWLKKVSKDTQRITLLLILTSWRSARQEKWPAIPDNWESVWEQNSEISEGHWRNHWIQRWRWDAEELVTYPDSDKGVDSDLESDDEDNVSGLESEVEAPDAGK